MTRLRSLQELRAVRSGAAGRAEDLDPTNRPGGRSTLLKHALY